jgi:hypothetical protein
MPSAVPAAVSYGWLGPHLSFGRDSSSAPGAAAAVADHGLALLFNSCKADQGAAVAEIPAAPERLRKDMAVTEISGHLSW